MLFAFAGLDAVDDVDFFRDVVDLPGAHAEEEVTGSGAVCPADISRPEGEAAVTRKDVDLAEGVQHLIPVLGLGGGPVHVADDGCRGVDVERGGVFPMFVGDRTEQALPFLGVVTEENVSDRVGEVVDLRDGQSNGQGGEVDVQAQAGPERLGVF